jgi:hypothetical protein
VPCFTQTLICSHSLTMSYYMKLPHKCKIFHILGFEVLTAVIILRDLTACSLLKVNQSFGGTYRLHIQGWIIRVRYQCESKCQAIHVFYSLVFSVKYNWFTSASVKLTKNTFWNNQYDGKNPISYIVLETFMFQTICFGRKQVILLLEKESKLSHVAGSQLCNSHW